MLSADHNLLKQEMKLSSEKRRKFYNERDGGGSDDNSEEINMVTELDEELDGLTFKDVKSSSSCKITDI